MALKTIACPQMRGLTKKLLLIMNFTAILLLCGSLTLSAAGFSQKVTLSAKNAKLEKVFRDIKKQTGYGFLYTYEILNKAQPVTLSVKDAELPTVLDLLFRQQPLSWNILEKTVVIKPKPEKINTAAIAQQDSLVEVTGSVSNENGDILPGVSIALKGTQLGATTDANGNYSLRLLELKGTLVFSHVSYEQQEVLIGNRKKINVVMKSKVSDMDQIVVVSYGTQKRKFVTGAVASIEADKLKDQPVSNLLNKLQGRLAGVQINQSTGTPGVGMAIKIRGAASIGAGNAPLYVVDGIPIVGGAFGIANINPDEVENISVLKDASAASLYGSRAANGVVLITTKKANPGETKISLSAVYGLSKVPQKGRPDLMNAEEWVQFKKEIYEDKARYEGYTGGIPPEYQDPSAWRGKGTNWYDVLLGDGFSSDYSLSVLAGRDKFKSSLVISYFDQKGVVLNTDYSRMSLRSNNEYRINDNIRIGSNLSITRQSAQNFNTDDSYQILHAAFGTPPIFSPFDKDADGNIKTRFTATGTLAQPNWYRTLTEIIDRKRSNGMISNSFLEVRFLKNFVFKSTFGAELEDYRNRYWRPSTASGDVFSPPPKLAEAKYNTNSDISWVWENNVTYATTFAQDHNVELLAGYSSQRYTRESNTASGNNFEDNLIPWISGGPPQFRSANSGATQWSLLGEYARLNYNYKGKYLLNAAMRRDGSSRFGANNRWGSFPSLSLGWIVTEENFANELGALSYLKLRAGYGVTGNFNIGNYTQYPNVGSGNYPLNQTIQIGRPITSLGNSLLTWETTKGINVGIDMAFFNGRISLNADYYNKTTDGLLYDLEVPASSGFNTIKSNVGKFKLWGYELAVSTINLKGNLTWTTDINVSINRNKVLQLGANNTPIGGIKEQLDTWRTEVGKPIGQFWGYVFDGIYMTQQEYETQPHGTTSMAGTVRWKDLNKDGVITADDRTFIGDPNPRFIFGINNSFSYKQFDLGIVASGAVGGDIFDGKAEWLELIDGLFNTYSDVQYRWRSEQDPGAGIIPRTAPASTTGQHRKDNSRYVYKNNYLTVKNITLGYTYSRPVQGISSIRAFLSIQQAFVLSKYGNPEISVNGLNGLKEGKDAAAYPIPRVFSVGLNVNF